MKGDKPDGPYEWGPYDLYKGPDGQIGRLFLREADDTLWELQQDGSLLGTDIATETTKYLQRLCDEAIECGLNPEDIPKPQFDDSYEDTVANVNQLLSILPK